MAERDGRRIESLALFLLLFSLSLLAWSGTFHSSDGLSMYTVADSLARYGQWDTEQIRWMGIQQGTFGPDGLLYSRKGFATSVAALPLVWLGLVLPDIGPAHAALLLTPLLHALTGLYLYHAAGRAVPGIRREGQLAVALLWAFASLALPYVKTFFSEPAVALAMTGALFHLLRFRDGGRLGDAAAAGGWLGFSFVTRSANAIVFPLYGLALLAYGYEARTAFLSQGSRWLLGRLRTRRRVAEWLWSEWTLARVLAFGLPILLALSLYLWYNWFRFGNPLVSGYIEGEEFTAIWWEGILGQTLSPGRGLLWYVPWLLLAFPGAARLWRQDRVLLGLTAGSVLLYILFYGKWYLWSGGFAWGPRFLVPIVPLLALLVAPLLGEGRRRGQMVALALLGLLGLAVNLVGVLWDFDLQQAALEASGLPLFAPESFFDPRYAQIPGLLRAGLAQPGSVDLAWMTGGFAERRLLALTVAIGLAGVGAGSWAWRKRGGGLLLLTGSVLVASSLWLLLGDLRAFQTPALQDALHFLPEPLPPSAQLWYDDPTVSEALMNQVKAAVPITGFNVGGKEMAPEEGTMARALAARARGPIFLVTDGPDRLNNGLDLVLLDHLFRLDSQQSGPYRVESYWQGPLSEPIGYDLRLSFPEGATMRLLAARVTPEVSRGEVLALELRWEVASPLPPDTQLFLQLYDEAGERVLQGDGPLLQGVRSAGALQPDETIVDRHALRLPPTLPPGAYTLHAGLYRIGDLARAATAEGQDEIVIPIAVR